MHCCGRGYIAARSSARGNGAELVSPLSRVQLWRQFRGLDLCRFDESCQRTVPDAITCALESDSFEDAVRNVISLGGDANTLAAIAGAISEAMHGILETLQEHAVPCYFTDASDMLEIIQELYSFV